MNTSTNVVRLRQPEELEDALTDVLRSGARRLLALAVELEAEAFLAGMQDLKLPDGRDRLVRHGYGPERMIQTGIGPVAVSRVKIRDRGAASDGDRVRFSSSILPKWARRTRSLDALLPILYLRGISTGDFQEALAALLGRDAPNLSPSVIARLSAEWQAEYEHWQRRDLSARRYVYLWADGVYLQARMEEHAECMLVMIGATPEGGKELVGFQVGVRESAQSWRELLVEVKRRGLTIAPEIAVGDGALGFWKALDEIYPGTRHQRCWVHKTANVLNKVPRAVQASYHGVWVTGSQAARLDGPLMIRPRRERGTGHDGCNWFSPLSLRQVFPGGHNKFEDHQPGRGRGQLSLGPDGPAQHRCEHTFDGVPRFQVIPVLGREVVEGQQGVAILGEAFDCPGVLRPVFLSEDVDRSLRSRPGLRAVDLAQVDLHGRLDGARTLFSTLAVLCTQQR